MIPKIRTLELMPTTHVLTNDEWCLMNSKTGGNDLFQGMGWVAGSASALLLISDGLALLAQQAHEQVSVTILLLALYLAPWLYVLGLVGLLFLSVWWSVRWLRGLVKPGAVSRYSAEPRRRHLERPEREGPQFLQQAWLLLLRADRRGIAMTGTRQTIEPESPEMGKEAGSFLMA